MQNRYVILLLFVIGLTSKSHAQLMWQTIPSPVGTLTQLSLGPNGELATYQNGNPIQPKISTDGGNTWQTMAGTGGPNGNFAFDQRWHMTNAGSLLFAGALGLSPCGEVTMEVIASKR